MPVTYAVGTVTVAVAFGGAGGYKNQIDPGTYDTVESVPHDRADTDSPTTVGGMHIYPDYTKGNLSEFSGTLDMSGLAGPEASIDSVSLDEARFAAGYQYNLDAYDPGPDTNSDGNPEYESLVSGYITTGFQLDCEYDDEFGTEWGPTYTGGGTAVAYGYGSVPASDLIADAGTLTPTQDFGGGAGFPGVGSIPVRIHGRMFDSHRWLDPTGFGYPAAGFDVAFEIPIYTPNFGGRTDRLEMTDPVLDLDFVVYYHYGTFGGGGGTAAGVLGANAYDVSLDMRHYRAYADGGTVVLGRNTNLHATTWHDVHTAIMGGHPAVRVDKWSTEQAVYLTVEAGSPPAIVRYKTLDDGGSVTNMGTIFADGAHPALVITRDGRHCHYARTAGSAVEGIILDPFGGTVLGPFTAIAGPIDDDGIAVGEYLTGGGDHFIKLTYVSGGTIVDKSSRDGKNFL